MANQSKGGTACAAKLTPEERSTRAQKAGRSRGQPSKGERVALMGRVDPDLATAFDDARAERGGMDRSDAVAQAVRFWVDHGGGPRSLRGAPLPPVVASSPRHHPMAHSEEAI